MSASDDGTKDLVILVADRNVQVVATQLLARRQSLRIRPVSFDVFVHPERDPGCLLKSDRLLSSLRGRYDHALVMFDRQGCGAESETPDELEQRVTKRLEQTGWQRRAIAIVLDPELESWVWSDSPQVDRILGWSGRTPDLRTWLVDKDLLDDSATKPDDPKHAMELALREVRRPRSSARFDELARKVGLTRCRDRAFCRFRDTMREWFPVTQ